MKKYSITSSRLGRAIKLFIGGILLAAVSSCSDFLTIYPTNSVVLENYWKEKADVEAMVSNCYRSMAQLDFLEKFIIWGEIRSDNVIEGTFTNDHTDLRNINEANLYSTNGYCSWANYYGVINNCNIVLKFAPEVLALDPDYTEGDYNVHRGEMLAIRALCHFCLLRTFRDIPLLTEAMIDDSQELYQAQVPPLVALDCILEDLYQAEGLVMKSGNYLTNAENRGRITQDAVRAMIADALLWKAAFTQYEAKGSDSGCSQYYAECAAYCDSIINGRMAYLLEHKDEIGNIVETMKYPLVPNFSAAGSYSGSRAYDNVFGSSNSLIESIFEIQISGSDNVEEQNYVVPKLYGMVAGDDARFVASTYLSTSKEGSAALFPLTDIRRVTFMNTLNEDTDDCPIAKYTVMSHGGVFSKSNPKMSYVYRVPEYQGDDKLNYHEMYYIENCNWIVYRIADVMLMKAEALAHRADATTNDLDRAFEMVKATYYRSNDREKANNIPASDTLRYSTAAELQDMVMQERQRELCFEGKRWYDLVRKALRDGNVDATIEEVVNHKYSLSPSSYKNKMPDIDYLFFPIQEREINANPLLKQNPAYETESMYEKN